MARSSGSSCGARGGTGTRGKGSEPICYRFVCLCVAFVVVFCLGYVWGEDSDLRLSEQGSEKGADARPLPI